jgi:excisionase family DNA binding protein
VASQLGVVVGDDGDRMERLAGDVLTAREVALLLRVNIKTVYESAKTGTIPCVRLGRHFRFSRRAIMARLEQCKSAPRWEGH